MVKGQVLGNLGFKLGFACENGSPLFNSLEISGHSFASFKLSRDCKSGVLEGQNTTSVVDLSTLLEERDSLNNLFFDGRSLSPATFNGREVVVSNEFVDESSYKLGDGAGAEGDFLRSKLSIEVGLVHGSDENSEGISHVDSSCEVVFSRPVSFLSGDVFVDCLSVDHVVLGNELHEVLGVLESLSPLRDSNSVFVSAFACGELSWEVMEDFIGFFSSLDNVTVNNVFEGLFSIENESF